MAQTVNYTNQSLDTTTRIFDQFYQYETVVPSNEYDVIYSYFNSVFQSPVAAGNFTTSLFRIAQSTTTPVMELFKQLSGKSVVEITATLAYYLNSVRSPCTLLGVTAPAVPNWYVARNIAA